MIEEGQNAAVSRGGSETCLHESVAEGRAGSHSFARQSRPSPDSPSHNKESNSPGRSPQGRSLPVMSDVSESISSAKYIYG